MVEEDIDYWEQLICRLLGRNPQAMKDRYLRRFYGEIRCVQAAAYMEKARTNAARKALLQVLKLNERSYRARSLMVKLALQDGLWDEAEDIIRELEAVDSMADIAANLRSRLNTCMMAKDDIEVLELGFREKRLTFGETKALLCAYSALSKVPDRTRVLREVLSDPEVPWDSWIHYLAIASVTDSIEEARMARGRSAVCASPVLCERRLILALLCADLEAAGALLEMDVCRSAFEARRYPQASSEILSVMDLCAWFLAWRDPAKRGQKGVRQ